MSSESAPVDTAPTTTEDPFAVPQSSATMTTPEQPAEPAPILRGCVKWFNDEKAYGFIKVIDPPSPDVFVHIRDLKPKFAHTPTLYTGEYVEFSTAPNGVTEDGTERLKAVNVTGINDGTLMCDHGQINFRAYSRVGFNNPSQ